MARETSGASSAIPRCVHWRRFAPIWSVELRPRSDGSSPRRVAHRSGAWFANESPNVPKHCLNHVYVPLKRPRSRHQSFVRVRFAPVHVGRSGGVEGGRANPSRTPSRAGEQFGWRLVLHCGGLDGFVDLHDFNDFGS